MSRQVVEFGQTVERPDEDSVVWLDERIAAAQCLVVLIGATTRDDSWVRESIAAARRNQIPIIGVTIDKIADEHGEQGGAPRDPFVTLGLSPRAISQIEVYEPPFVLSVFARSHIAYSMPDWVDLAVRENTRRLGSRGGRVASIGRSSNIDLEARAS